MMKNILIIMGLISVGLILQSCGNQASKNTNEEAVVESNLPVEWSKKTI